MLRDRNLAHESKRVAATSVCLGMRAWMVMSVAGTSLRINGPFEPHSCKLE